jgi:hypothetical protein
VDLIQVSQDRIVVMNPLGCVTGEQFIDELSYYQLLEDSTASWKNGGRQLI